MCILPIAPVTLESRSRFLLGRCSRQLHNICTDGNMVHSRAERVFVLKHYFASKSFAAAGEVFCNAHPNLSGTIIFEEIFSLVSQQIHRYSF
jgi:hypothetical protein